MARIDQLLAFELAQQALEQQRCPHIQRRLAGDETYDICALNTKPCLIEHGLYECEVWNEIKEEVHFIDN